jgi:hypothetical protein
VNSSVSRSELVTGSLSSPSELVMSRSELVKIVLGQAFPLGPDLYEQHRLKLAHRYGSSELSPNQTRHTLDVGA